MKLKEYLYCLVADQPVAIEEAEEDTSISWLDRDTTFADKTLIPKEILDLEVRKFCGSIYYPGNFCSEEDECFYDPYEDWYGCVRFYVNGFQKVKDKLGLKGIVK